MGNSETVSKRTRQSSYSGKPTANSYDKIHSQNSLSDLDSAIVSTPIMIECLNESEKLQKNKLKLKLRAEFSHLVYAVRYFNVQPSLTMATGVTTAVMTENEDEGIGQEINRYEGTFKNGQLFGQGIYFYPSGSIYMGGIKDNGRQGEGVFYFSNGNIYTGLWSNNDQNGKGKFFFVQNGKVFQFFYGQFQSSLYNGFGCYCYQTKYYIGFWKDDKYDGVGKIYTLDGTLVKCGLFRADRLVEQLDENMVTFPSNWKEYIPNFTKEIALYHKLAENKPIL